jgi:hypothetical protein
MPDTSDFQTRTPINIMDLLVFVAIFAFWIVLQIWVLPKAGVPT